MTGPRPQSVTLAELQRILLKRLTRRQMSPYALVRRARIFLLVAEGEKQADCSRDRLRMCPGTRLARTLGRGFRAPHGSGRGRGRLHFSQYFNCTLAKCFRCTYSGRPLAA